MTDDEANDDMVLLGDDSEDDLVFSITNSPKGHMIAFHSLPALSDDDDSRRGDEAPVIFEAVGELIEQGGFICQTNRNPV